MTNARLQPEIRTTTTTSTRGSSTSTSIYTGAGRVTPEDLKIIRDCYVDVLGDLTSPVARMIERFLTMGMEAAVICNAIEETGFAPRPSPQYLRAILTRYAANDLMTLQRVLEDETRRASRVHEAIAERNERWYR